VNEWVGTVHDGDWRIDNINKIFSETSQQGDGPTDSSQHAKNTTKHNHSQLRIKSSSQLRMKSEMGKEGRKEKRKEEKETHRIFV
jgi:hypothetical protein